MSRDQPADANDDWTLHLALGLEVGAGGTITAFNAFPTTDSTLFFTSVQWHLRHQTWLRRPPGPAAMVAAGPEPRAHARPRDALRAVRLDLGSLLRGPGAGACLHRVRLDVRVRRRAGDRLRPAGRAGLQHRSLFPLRRLHQPGLARQQRRSRLEHRRRVHLPLRPGGAGAQADHRAARGRGGTWHITIPDTDRDGVADDEDQCKDAPAGAHPDPFRPGCPESDEDGDGVPDVDDACPVTPPGPKPDPKRPGCPFIDSDGDGISDADDACPSKPGVASSDPPKNGCPDAKKRAPAARPLRRRRRTNPSRPSRSRSTTTSAPAPKRSTGGERIN